MLIECPECNKQISDKADVCINCGFPLKELKKSSFCIVNGKELDMTKIYEYANELLEDNSNRVELYEKAEAILETHTNLSSVEMTGFFTKILKGERPTHYTGETQEEFERKHAKPKCPTCSSTDIQKIGAGERVTSVATLGLFSKKINKTFKCKNCKYTW